MLSFAEEEDRQHAGAHMGAGDRLMGAENQFHGFGNGADLVSQRLGFFETVAVGNGNGLRFRSNGAILVKLCQSFHSLFTSAAFLTDDDMALFVTPKNGLDIQHGSHQCAGGAEAAGAPQEHQIVHG